MNSIWLIVALAAPPAVAEIGSVEELEPLKRAHEEVDHVKRGFRAALQQAVGKKGAAKAIDACRIEAPKLGGSRDGMEIGRTSHRLRNPENAPRPWVGALLEKWTKLEPGRFPKHELVKLGPNHWGYVEPIVVEPLCLSCHGKTLEPVVAAAIRASYPADRATGFEVGELRGLFWLEMKP